MDLLRFRISLIAKMCRINLASFLMAGHTESQGGQTPRRRACCQLLWGNCADHHVALLLRCTHVKKKSRVSHIREGLNSFINLVLVFCCWHLMLSSFLSDGERFGVGRWKEYEGAAEKQSAAAASLMWIPIWLQLTSGTPAASQLPSLSHRERKTETHIDWSK